MLKLADIPVADQLAAEQHLGIMPLLGPVLKNDVVAADRLNHSLALGDGAGERFLAIDGFAGARGGNGHQRVPMIGRGDIDSVNVRASQNLAEIIVGRTGRIAVIVVDDVFALLPPGLLHVAHGHELSVLAPEKHLPPKTQADDAHDHAIARRGCSIATEGGGWDDPRGYARDEGAAQEGAPRQRVLTSGSCFG